MNTFHDFDLFPSATPARSCRRFSGDLDEPIFSARDVSRLLCGRAFLVRKEFYEKPSRSGSRATPVARLPYPQTPQTASAWINEHGITVSGLARRSGVDRSVLVDLLRGKLRGHRGVAHDGAIVLGLKADPAL